jgi:hypothetical protein
VNKTMESPVLAGVTFVALPDPPVFELRENWLGSRSGGRCSSMANRSATGITGVGVVHASRMMAQRHLDAFELGYWRAWLRNERERAVMLAELDAAEVA